MASLHASNMLNCPLAPPALIAVHRPSASPRSLDDLPAARELAAHICHTLSAHVCVCVSVGSRAGLRSLGGPMSN